MAYKLPRWTQRPDVLSYVINSYAGLDAVEDSNVKRRVFIWEEETEIMMGNCEAFCDHLEERFGLISVSSSDVHALLRELGEHAQFHKAHPSRKIGEGPSAGRFKLPEPDKWVVGRIDKPTTDTT